MKGSQFIRYLNPVLQVLKDNGGVGAASEIIDGVIAHLNIQDAEVEVTIPSGQSRVRNQIQWARYYLAKAGLVDSPKSGVWRLTQEGTQTALTTEQAKALVQKIVKKYHDSRKAGAGKTSAAKNEDIATVEDEEHTEDLLDVLKNLTPKGFERICKRLLTEIGIHDIQITGGAGDQGIDGIGRIRLNDVVNFNIVFQCKRYKETVSPALVRDFRGSMQGRAEKGLILTTGRFTQEAQKEANRDGVPPIELIDGERLVGLFEKYELGLKPKIVYELVPEFFKSFES